MNDKRIIQNQVQCNRCGGRPYSAHTHDFKRCQCGAIAVDGGLDYLRRVGDPQSYTDLSIELSSQLIEDMIAALNDETRNNFGHVCAIMRLLRDSGEWVPSSTTRPEQS